MFIIASSFLVEQGHPDAMNRVPTTGLHGMVVMENKTMPSTIQILGFTGSLRKGSYNQAALREARELLPDGADLEIVSLDNIPLFNQDYEYDEPEPVRSLKAKVKQADAVLIVTPEANYSIPGVLKNAIDWISWPIKMCPLTGKPTAILGAGGRVGTARAQLHLRQILAYLDVPVITKPEVFIINAWEKFDSEGNLTDERSRQEIKLLLERLVDAAQAAGRQTSHL
jgi:chromate reductase